MDYVKRGQTLQVATGDVVKLEAGAVIETPAAARVRLLRFFKHSEGSRLPTQMAEIRIEGTDSNEPGAVGSS